MTTTILLIGAGAVGAFYASRLAQTSSVKVSVICRSNFEAVSSRGFTLSSPKFGTWVWIPHWTFSSRQDAAGSGIKWDFIVVSTKALPEVADESEVLVGLVTERHTTIVLVQNGLGIEEPYTTRFPSAVILSAVTVISAAQTAPGVIQHHRWTRIGIGPYFHEGPSPGVQDERIASEQCNIFVDLLSRGGIKDAEQYTHSKLQMLRWHKIAINASMSPASVLSGGCYSRELVMDDELRIHIKAILDEVLSTAPKVLGFPFPKEFATADQLLASFARNASDAKSSMLLDWEQGKTMELEVILGSPIRIARRHGLEMPRLQSVYGLIRMAQMKRDQGRRSKI